MGYNPHERPLGLLRYCYCRLALLARYAWLNVHGTSRGKSARYYFLFHFSLKGERGSPGPVGPPGEKGVTVSQKLCRIHSYVTYKGTLLSKTIINSHSSNCVGFMENNSI